MYIAKSIAVATACLLAASPMSGQVKQKSAITDMDMFIAMYGVEINEGNDIQEILAEKTGVRVKETYLDGEDPSVIIDRMIESGQLPDLIDGGDCSEDLYDARTLVAWDDYLAKPEFANLKAMYSDDEWDKFRQGDGKIYWANVFSNSYNGTPVNRLHNDEAFWIQVRVLEWANYPVIETLDDYFKLLEDYYKEHKANPDGTKIIPYTCLCEDWRYFCIENAGMFLDGYPNNGSVIVKDPDTNPTVVDFNTTPTTKKYLQKLNTIYQKGMMDLDFATQTYDEYIEKLNTGAVLGMCDQWWDFAFINDDLKASGLDEIGCNYVPLGPTISKGMKNQWHTRDVDWLDSGSGVAVTKKCKDVEKAFRFLNSMLDQDIHNLRFWGVKDVDYLVDDTGEFYRTQKMRDNWSDPAYLAKHACMYNYCPQYCGMSRDGINTMHPEDSKSEFFADMAAPLKKCFEAYGYDAYWQFLRSDLDAKIYPWYPMYQFSNVLMDDTPEGDAWIKMGETKHQYLPMLVMTKNFDSLWTDYMKAYSACKPELFINYMQEMLDTFKGQTPGEDPTFEDFVERLYTVALGRASEPEGKEYWIKQVVEEGKTGADCARFFLLDADEFMKRNLSVEDFVETLYETFFDRESDPEGKAGWVDAIKTGKKTRAEVVNDFIESTEWCDVCATYGVKSGAQYHKATKASKNAINFATRLYTCCLNREAEEGGLKYWSLALTNLEQTGCSAAKEFFTCKEFVDFNLKDEEYIKRLYTTFMDREPEASEVNYWIGEINKGTQTRESVLAFFGQSDEFTQICKKYGIDRGTI